PSGARPRGRAATPSTRGRSPRSVKYTLDASIVAKRASSYVRPRLTRDQPEPLGVHLAHRAREDHGEDGRRPASHRDGVASARRARGGAGPTKATPRAGGKQHPAAGDPHAVAG